MTRLLAVAFSFLVLAACTGQGTDTSASATTTSAPAAPDGVALAYEFRPGDSLAYGVELTQHLQLTTDGEAAAVVDESLPGTADLTITASGVFVFEVSEGPEDDTFRVDIEGDFTETSVSGTADGEEVDEASDVDQLGTLQPVAASVVMDRSGRVRFQGQGAGGALGGGPLTGLAGDLSQFVGPLLPDEPVTVGSSWSGSDETLILGDRPVQRTVEGRVTGVETVAGTEGWVIETVTATGAAEMDLADFFAEFLSALAEEDAPEDLDTLVEELVFRILVEPAESQSRTVFDPEAGEVLQSAREGTGRLVMEVALPDEETGEIQRYDMQLETDQHIEYSLATGPDG